MTAKLWELTEDILALEDLLSDIQASEDLSESDKETRIQHTLEQWLGSGQAFDDKACKVAAYIKHLEALAEARKQEYGVGGAVERKTELRGQLE